MNEKENARRACQHGRAYVREHDQIISRDFPMTWREARWLGAIFSACGFAIVLAGCVL